MLQRALLVLTSLASLVLLHLPASAQSWLWARRIGGACYDYYVYPMRVASDAQGNVYVTGYFYYYFTAEGVTYYTYNFGAHVDMFVAKYSPTGVLQWVRVGGGTGSDYGYGIGVDANGNVYVTGYYYSNPAVFGSWSLAAATTPDVFLVKYDANGNVLWAARMAGTSTDIVYNLAVDANGNSYLTGYFSSSTTFFSAGSTTGTTLPAVGSGVEAFVAVYNTNGVFQWARAIGGSSSEYGYGVGVDQSGNVYVSGYYYSNPIYVGSTAMSLSVAYATPEIFLAKFNPSGTALWVANAMVGSSTEILYDMSTDASGNSFLTGYTTSNPAYAISAAGSGGGTITISRGTTTAQAFAVRFNTNGVAQWGSIVGGTVSTYGYGIDVDNRGNIYLGGYHYGSFTFGSSTISVSATPDVFILVWQSDGTADFGVAATGNSTDILYHLRVSRPRREAAITGYFLSTPLTFGNISINNDSYTSGCYYYAAGFLATMRVRPNLDAGIVGLANPQPPFASGNQGVTIRLQNFGRQPITSITVAWSVDGTPQSPQTWTGTLSSDAVTTLTLGTLNFAPRTIVNLQFSITAVNGLTDEDASNNALTAQRAPALAGAYTIGGTSPDFPSFTAAANYLHIGGVLDTVTFRVRSGVYTEQLNLNATIPGAGLPTRRITFESESGNAASVTLRYAATSSLDNFVVRLNELKHVVLRNLTIQNTGASFGRVIWLTSTSSSLGAGCDDVTIEGCQLIGRSSTSTATADAVVYAYENNHNNLVLRNNTIRNGSVGVFVGSWWFPLTTGLRLEGNTIRDFYVGALYALYLDAPVVVRNQLIGSPTSIASGGYYLYFLFNDNAITVERNHMWGMPGGSGVLVNSFYSSVAATARIVNNFIEIGNNTANLSRGIDIRSRSNIAIVHNSVNVRSTNASSAAFYSAAGSSLRVTHNIFINSGTGWAIWANSAFAASPSACNYNNLYSVSGPIGWFGGSNRQTLADWRTATNYDANSISKPVPWASGTDLHLTQVDEPLYTGVPQNADVPVDIDGEGRRVWYMGADEVIPVITITQQPVDTTRGCLGTSTTLRIQATATFNARLSYQWLRNGAPIPEGYDGRFFGTTTPTLSIQNTKPTDEGAYACLVTGNSGATPVLSNLSILIVWSPIEITQQPESQFACVGGEVVLGVLANGTIFGYQWQRETPAGWQDIPGATQGQLRLSNLQYSSSGRYRCVLFGTCGTEQLPTDPAVVFVLGDVQFTAAPDTVATALGGRAELSVEAEVVGAPPTYQPQYQ
ncbi:MAG: SBBP repeat-containing protein, partial [Candidatus Kapabacteria bacterium]|nr:SBBP repeat-containing protein [Candidatus Kapabacteria bacterium]